MNLKPSIDSLLLIFQQTTIKNLSISDTHYRRIFSVLNVNVWYVVFLENIDIIGIFTLGQQRTTGYKYRLS